jgi:hypothetical protein
VAEGPKKPSLVGSGASNQPPPPSGSVRVDTVPVNLPESFLSTNLLAGASVVSAPDSVREAPASALTLAEPEPHDVHASTSPQSPSDAQIIAAKAASDLLASVSARVDAENGVDGDAQITEGVPGEEQFVYSIATFAGISEQGGLWSTSGWSNLRFSERVCCSPAAGFGHDVRDKPNQDAIVMAEDPETGALVSSVGVVFVHRHFVNFEGFWYRCAQLMAVFDGHGPFGHLVSDRLRVMVPPSLFGQPTFPNNMAQALQAAINEVENIILQGLPSWWLVCRRCVHVPYIIVQTRKSTVLWVVRLQWWLSRIWTVFTSATWFVTLNGAVSVDPTTVRGDCGFVFS